MKRKSFLMLLVVFFSLISTSCSNSFIKNKVDEENAESTTKVSYTITMRDIADYLLTKEEHYPLSDEFIEKYQQSSGGYIENAKKAGIEVNKQKHSPNQKWHFFESWLYPSIEDGTLSWTESAKSRVYSKLLCPELLLWIYEACEVDPTKVRAAMKVAEAGKVNKTNTSTVAKNMRQCVAWEDLEKTLLNYVQENN